MRKPCIVKPLLTMQGFSIFGPAPGPPFLIFRPGGLRTVTEFIGFAGRRTQTVPARGPPFPEFTARGSRKETEFIGFAGSQARTAPAPGPPFLNFRPRSRHQYTWRMASMIFSAPTTEIPVRLNLLFFFGRIIFS